MLTKVRNKINYPEDIEVVKYPYEFVAELENEAEIARLKYRAGELKSMSADDLALKFGVNLNDSKI